MLTVGGVLSAPSEVNAPARRALCPRGSATIRSYWPPGSPGGTSALRMSTLTQVTSSRAKLPEPVGCGADGCAEMTGPISVALNPPTSTPALPAAVSN